MKRIGTVLYCYFIITVFSLTAAAGTWTECSPPSVPRWYPGCGAIGNDIYLIGGQDSIPPFSSMTDVEVYDTSTDTWSSAAPLDHDRWGMAVSVLDGRIYAIGGQSGSFMDGYSATDFVEVYDPGTDTWTDLAPMPTARGWCGCASVGGAIYVFGGYDPDVETTGMEVEKYDPVTDSWSSCPPMDDYRETFCCIALEDRIYLIGGWGNDLVQVYDPDSSEWTGLAPLPTPRGGSGICLLDGDIVVVGGRGGADAVESYDTVNDSWTAMPSLPTPREGLVAACIDGKIYAITGSEPVSEGGLPYYGLVECLDTGIQ